MRRLPEVVHRALILVVGSVALPFAVLAGAAASLAAAGGTSVGAMGSSGTSGYCPTAKGVTVVADFTALGGGVQIRCAAGATSSTDGLDALHEAGFSTAGTVHDGEGFVCRINNQPSATADSCLNTPPATAYWSYWSAPNKGSWSYSNVGAKSHQVIVGGFEGWRFHSSKVDGKSLVAPHATPTRPPPPVQPTFSLGPATSAATTHHTTAPSKATTSSPSTTSARPSTSAPSTASPLAIPEGTSSTPPVEAGSAAANAPPPSGGSPWPFVIGLIVVVIVGGGAGLALFLRSRPDGGGP